MPANFAEVAVLKEEGGRGVIPRGHKRLGGRRAHARHQVSGKPPLPVGDGHPHEPAVGFDPHHPFGEQRMYPGPLVRPSRDHAFGHRTHVGLAVAQHSGITVHGDGTHQEGLFTDSVPRTSGQFRETLVKRRLQVHTSARQHIQDERQARGHPGALLERQGAYKTRSGVVGAGCMCLHGLHPALQYVNHRSRDLLRMQRVRG